MDGTVVVEKGDGRKAGEMGFTKSFCRASLAARELELRCCLLYGLYLGLVGLPATLSLCRLLEMCCLSWISELTWTSQISQ